jgi:DNA processing protein
VSSLPPEALRDGPAIDACAECLRRSWLIARLAAHLERRRSRIFEVLCLGDQALVDALGGRRAPAVQAGYAAFDAERERERLLRLGVGAVCACAAGYPKSLAGAPGRPAVIYLRSALPAAQVSRLLVAPSIAVVGARRASPYGAEVASQLGRSLAASGLHVLSGLAGGIDSAAHAGALETGTTLGVLAAGPERAQPKAQARLYIRIAGRGACLSELPPGVAVWRWALVARNRIIAGLAEMTVVVEAAKGSGALVTAARARDLGRPVGAVPGRITTPQAWGTNELLAGGATVVRGAEDVLERLGIPAQEGGCRGRPRQGARTKLCPQASRLLEALAEGRGVDGAISAAGLSAEEALERLSELELEGHLRRVPGGAYEVLP